MVDQKRLGGNARSTVGAITENYTLLRLLYSRVDQPSWDTVTWSGLPAA